MRVLVLGGTSEASALARLLADTPGVEATVSLAGRTEAPRPLPLPTRIGGFGGPEGLAAHLVAERIDRLVDATHPFAARMSWNAVEAAARTGVPLVALGRPAWTPAPGDRWTEVDDLAAAARALGETPRRVLLTVGRLGLAAFAAAPQHDYLVRTIDAPGALPFPRGRAILERPPFDTAAERALMESEGIEVLVTKNSGAAATSGKIEAARVLGLEVVMVRRPARPPGVRVLETPQAVMAWLEG